MFQLSEKWAPVLNAQPETGMGYQIASVLLKDGRRFENVLIVGGVVARVGDSEDIPFGEEDVADLVVTHGAGVFAT
jgi:hypothetical protein